MRGFSLVALLTLACLAGADPFGRFGYRQTPNIPGFLFTRTGFRAKDAGADEFRFAGPLTRVRPSLVSQDSAEYELGGASKAPSRARVDLYSHGFKLAFPAEMVLTSGSTSCPYLSWGSGSVRNGVPTPAAKWFLITFASSQPPVLVVFEGARQSLRVDGAPGAWTIHSESPMSGWARFCLPLGLKGRPTASAASLGLALADFQREEQFWTAPTPTLQKLIIDDSLLGITATWVFDQPLACFSPAAWLAPLGGYPIEAQSRLKRLAAIDEDGPTIVSEDSQVKLYFPARRAPAGRFLSLGTRSAPEFGQPDPKDIPAVVELALANMSGWRTRLEAQRCENSLSQYLLESTYEVEPWSKQQIPFGPTGTGVDVAAAQALAMQCLSSAKEAGSSSNSLLLSLDLVRDTRTWRYSLDDSAASRRAAALACVADSLCPEPERRLEGALLQAGLAAERGLGIFFRREGILAHEAKIPEPLWGVRQILYALRGPADPMDGFGQALLTPLRVYGEPAMQATSFSSGYELSWNADAAIPGEFAIAAGFPVTIKANKNLPGFLFQDSPGLSSVRFRSGGPGQCSVTLGLPSWARPLPAAFPWPRYSESSW